MAYSITKDNYFDLEQPAKSNELFNAIEVPISPFAVNDDTEDVYTSEEEHAIDAGEVKTIIAEFNSIPVKDAEAVIVPSSGDIIIDEVETKYFAWGAKVVIENTGLFPGTFTMSITGLPFTVISEETIADENLSSIAENGRLKYEFPGNHLIQERAIAETIAAGLLESYSTPRKDVSISWRGNPALELDDEIEAPTYQKEGIDTRENFTVFKQKLDFDGTLRGSLEARKIAAEETTTTAGV